ncbi:MAG TPA: TIGR00730 family Rossman fold protein [Pirellulaceae bacterium]|nr:TIGR00730 family Rossman fold protein [Pirellulaceae bacterium]
MTSPLRSICVFCGSSTGNRQEYAAAAADFGRLLGERRIRLVYGAGNVGLMGVLADAALAAGGEVIGVIPQMLVDRELAHRGITDLRIVTSMHERKALMAELSDGFVALPGGLGTYEELCEVLTWAQLGIHHKPCGYLNVLGYFDPLARMFDHAVTEGFLRSEQRRLFISSNEPDALLRLLESHASMTEAKWPGREVI